MSLVHRRCIELPGKPLTIASNEPEVFESLSRLLNLQPDRELAPDFSIRKTSNTNWDIHCGDRSLGSAKNADDVLINLYGNIYEWYVPSSEYFLLHSGVITKDGIGILIVGQQESGKSTLTSVAISEGWNSLSDDVAVLDTAKLQCYRYPRNLLIRPKTLELNPYIKDVIDVLCVLDVYGDTAYVSQPKKAHSVSTTSIDLIVFPRWSDEDSVSPIASGEAAIRLMDNSLNLRHLGYSGVKMAAALARNCPALDLNVKDPRDAIHRIEKLAAC